eukprot:1157646-Pelagomonas_calceolata.AAC.7
MHRAPPASSSASGSRLPSDCPAQNSRAAVLPCAPTSCAAACVRKDAVSSIGSQNSLNDHPLMPVLFVLEKAWQSRPRTEEMAEVCNKQGVNKELQRPTTENLEPCSGCMTWYYSHDIIRIAAQPARDTSGAYTCLHLVSVPTPVDGRNGLLQSPALQELII